MPLGTLVDLKALLELPLDDTERDVALALTLEAAERAVLDATGYDLAATTRTQIFVRPQAQRGRWLQLDYRPVHSISQAVGRYAGQTADVPVEVDLIDAEQGRFTIVDFWRRPAGALWNARIWDRLSVTYTTDPIEPPPDLSLAALELAAYWSSRSSAGAYSQTQIGDMPIGQVREVYLTLGIPEWVEAKLSPYRRRLARWVS